MRILESLGNKISVNKALYYILNLTWGLPLTIIGFLIFLVLLPFGRVKRFKHMINLELRSKKIYWGMSIGMVFISGKDFPTYAKYHEFGHSVQNAIFGPFMLFIVSIPSSIRFWFRRIQRMFGKEPRYAYDYIWFEGSATNIGNWYRTYCFKEADKFIKNWEQEFLIKPTTKNYVDGATGNHETRVEKKEEEKN